MNNIRSPYFVIDTFQRTSTILVQNHVGELGATWTEVPPSTEDMYLLASPSSLFNGTNATQYYTASGEPANAEYTVESDMYVVFVKNYTNTMIMGRMSATDNTYYQAYMDPDDDYIALRRVINGSAKTLGSYSYNFTGGLYYNVKLELNNSAKKIYINDVEVISSIDNQISVAGKVGFAARGLEAGGGIHPVNLLAYINKPVRSVQHNQYAALFTVLNVETGDLIYIDIITIIANVLKVLSINSEIKTLENNIAQIKKTATIEVEL